MKTFYVNKLITEDESTTLILKARKFGWNCVVNLMGAGTIIEFYRITRRKFL